MAQKVVELVLQGCVRPYSLVAFVQQPVEASEYKPGFHGCLTCLRRQLW